MDGRLPLPRVVSSRQDPPRPLSEHVDGVDDAFPTHGEGHTKAKYSRVLRTQIGKVFRRIGRWLVRANQRNALADLDDHLLRDMGISRIDSQRAWADPVWKPRVSHEGWITRSGPQR
jgi:uncharacterized protein YjiS (DUF1127 family)